MPKYEQICVIFKSANKEIREWVAERSEEEDMSMSAFIIRSLKKIRKMEGRVRDGQKA